MSVPRTDTRPLLLPQWSGGGSLRPTARVTGVEPHWPARVGPPVVRLDRTDPLAVQAAMSAQARTAAATGSPATVDPGGKPLETQRCIDPKEGELWRLRAVPGIGISGVSQFTARGLSKLVQKHAGDRLVVLDLRQESHFFDEHGIAHHAHGEFNWGNLGRSDLQVQIDEARRGTTEAEICQQRGVGYVRIPIPDHSAASDDAVDRLVALYDWTRAQAAAGSPVHVISHCRAGMGRTTTSLALFQILAQATTRSAEEIVAEQNAIGDYDLFSIRDNDYTDEQRQRAQLIRDVHAYALYRDGTPPAQRLCFSRWKSQRQ